MAKEDEKKKLTPRLRKLQEEVGKQKTLKLERKTLLEKIKIAPKEERRKLVNLRSQAGQEITTSEIRQKALEKASKKIKPSVLKLEVEPAKKKPKKKLFIGPLESKLILKGENKKLADAAFNATKIAGETEEKKQGAKKGSLFDEETLQKAAVGLIPILVGGLLGGSEGALAGVQAGAEGLQKVFEIERDEKIAKEAAELKRELKKPSNEETALLNAKIKLTNAQAIKQLQTGPDALTETQAKARIFGSRMIQAEQDFTSLIGQFDPTDLRQRVQSNLPRELQSEEFQRFDQAKKNFLNAVLRKESGARISEEELEVGDEQYFPQPGDSDGVVSQKARNRALVTRLMSEEGKVDPNDPRIKVFFAKTTRLQQIDAEVLRRGL